MIYQFHDPSNGCHQYFVNAKSKKEASEKFISWQNAALPKINRWSEDDIKNLDNFQIVSDCSFIGFEL